MSTRHGVDRQESIGPEATSSARLAGQSLCYARLIVSGGGKSPYTRLDLDDYPVPPHAGSHYAHRGGRSGTGQSPQRAGGASHPRSYSKDAQIEEPTHIAKLVERKAQVHGRLGMSSLMQEALRQYGVVARAAKRGKGLGGITSSQLRLIEHYGVAGNYFHAGAGCPAPACGATGNRGVAGGQESTAAGGGVNANACG